MSSKGPSDSRLMKLWRLAVLAHWDYTDPLSGYFDLTGESLQCHHIIRRKHFLTRWDYRNGIPLTAESHRWAHTLGGRRAVEEVADMDYLWEMEKHYKKDWLQNNGLSERDFREGIKAELQSVIEDRQ